MSQHKVNEMIKKASQMRGKQIAPGLHPGISLDQLKPLECNCGNKLFIPCCNVYYASPLQSVTGMPTLVNVPQGFVCTSCGKQNEYAKKSVEGSVEMSKNDTPEEGQSGPH